MEIKNLAQQLSSIQIGTIITWFITLSGIVSAVAAGAIKLYKVFDKTRNIQEENMEFRNMVKSHEEQLKNMAETLRYIQKKLDERDKYDLTNMRYSLVRAGEEYISIGKITIRQLRSLEEMFEDYHEKRHGNGYVTTLMKKVRCLPIIGKLDDDENDIEE